MTTLIVLIGGFLITFEFLIIFLMRKKIIEIRNNIVESEGSMYEFIKINDLLEGLYLKEEYSINVHLCKYAYGIIYDKDRGGVSINIWAGDRWMFYFNCRDKSTADHMIDILKNQ